MPVAPAAPGAPVGTFVPGTKITCGSHRVVIQKYLSEGGFAHVYLVKLPKPVNGTDLAVLKRVAVPDKEALRGMRVEVETMKRLKGHKAIVTYIDSHASELRGGGYEVFLLMEYCNGGGLIDFMNTRLQHRLTEPEILQIFADVAEGVACMHYLKPPLLHRDLKVENVLISQTPAGRKFKLCDFGSAAAPRPAPTTTAECRLVDEDVQKHTTMQYRSPEMVDVYKKQPIDEKSDIWALGVLLYKLCYYTTPFEEQGQLAILNASYKFPSYPVFSERLKKLIASMLRENQKMRPNIYQVVKEACAMQGRECPIKDIYSGRTHSEPPKGEAVPRNEHRAGSTPVVGAVFSPPVQPKQVVPEVERMRRGRPPPASQPIAQPKPNPLPAKITSGDPFAALDAKLSSGGRDELSSRFPTLDEFSLLVESTGQFDFDKHGAPSAAEPSKDLSQRVTERLADEAFATPAATSSQRQSTNAPRPRPPSALLPNVQPPAKSASAPPKPVEMSRASAIISSTPELQAISSQASQPPVAQPTPTRPVMVSTGTNTTPPPERQAQFQMYRFPPSDHHRSASLPRQQDTGSSAFLRTDSPKPGPLRPGLDKRPPSFSIATHARHPSSSRPSLEGGRPSAEYLEPMHKTRSMPMGPGKPRPVSMHLESNLEFLREREAGSRSSVTPPLPSPRYLDKDLPPLLDRDDQLNITSNVDFLRSMEDDADGRKKDKGHHFRHVKKPSMSSLGSSTKHILGGKFGDVFKRFEGSAVDPTPARTPSPLKDMGRRNMGPIAGSEASEGRSDDGQVLEETDDMTPEMRREVERRRLSMEEKRVAAAAAEYRQRVNSRHPGDGSNPTPLPKGVGGVSRAVSIQNKVQSLLQEQSRSAADVKRTAHGYGHYSDDPPSAPPARASEGRPPVPRKPITNLQTGPRTIPPSSTALDSGIRRAETMRAPSSAAARPMAPPKPTHLNTGNNSRPASPAKPAALVSVAKTRSAPQPQQPKEHLVAVDMPGQPALEMSAAERDDYIRDFQKRFPSLTSIEMVERDLGAEAGGAGEAGRQR